METVKKIYPNSEELCSVNNFVLCTEEGCSCVFTSESNLTLHLVKTHGKGALKKCEEFVQYYCPVTACMYNARKHFGKMNALKQHYLKVHAKKCFECSKCSKCFSTIANQKSHSMYCGVTFYCLNCPQSYNCYETLTTHARRKWHGIYKKNEYIKTVKTDAEKNRPVTEQLTIVMIKSDVSDKSCQTESGTFSTDIKRKNSQTTQISTSKPKKRRASAETQTVENYDAKKPLKKSKISTRTQTKKIESFSKSCNTVNLVTTTDNLTSNSCSTQTISSKLLHPQQSNLLCNDFMQSTSEDNNLELFDSNFLNTIETQTDLMFEDHMFPAMSADFSSNMYTQTCDNLLLTQLGLNDIQTQTAQDEEDLLRSAQTQTMNFDESSYYNSCRDFSHMETQTDAHFKQILEEINA